MNNLNLNCKEFKMLAGLPNRETLSFEALQVLDSCLSLNDKQISLPTIGTVCLLELLSNNFIENKRITDLDVYEAILILNNKKNALGYVESVLRSDLPKKEFIDAIKKDYKENTALYEGIIKDYIARMNAGFEMLPVKKEEDLLELDLTFNSEFIISYIAICTSVTGYNMDYVLWELPVIAGGFIIAHNGKINGIKNIQRPLDIKEMTKYVKERQQ
jgi:hypothetical protein